MSTFPTFSTMRRDPLTEPHGRTCCLCVIESIFIMAMDFLDRADMNASFFPLPFFV